MSYRLKKDLRNIIKLYGNPGWVVSAEERFRAMMARAQFYKASAAPPLKGIPDLRLKNLKLFFISKINKLKYEYALKNLSDIDYFDIDVYNNFIDLYNKYLIKGDEIKPVPTGRTPTSHQRWGERTLQKAGVRTAPQVTQGLQGSQGENYKHNIAKGYIDHLYLQYVSKFNQFE